MSDNDMVMADPYSRPKADERHEGLQYIIDSHIYTDNTVQYIMDIPIVIPNWESNQGPLGQKITMLSTQPLTRP